MSLIVEDGRCPDFANSYVGLEEADKWLCARGIWAATPELEKEQAQGPEDEAETGGDLAVEDNGPLLDGEVVAAKEAALIRAFDFLNTLPWKGKKPCWQRVAAWPRDDVPIPGSCPVEFIDPDLVPAAVIQAQMELAGLIYNGYGPFAPREHGGRVKSVSDSKTETVDVLSESSSHSVSWADDAPVEDWLPSVYPLLRDFLEYVPGKASTGFTQHDVVRG